MRADSRFFKKQGKFVTEGGLNGMSEPLRPVASAHVIAQHRDDDDGRRSGSHGTGASSAML